MSYLNVGRVEGGEKKILRFLKGQYALLDEADSKWSPLTAVHAKCCFFQGPLDPRLTGKIDWCSTVKTALIFLLFVYQRILGT